MTPSLENDVAKAPGSESVGAAAAAAAASADAAATDSPSKSSIGANDTASLLPAVRDPIRLLRCYLSQLAAASNEQSHKNNEVEEENEPTQQSRAQSCRHRAHRPHLSAKQLDDLLRAADFLFGSNPPVGAAHNNHHHATGLLDGALALLDACVAGGDHEVAADGTNQTTHGQPSSSSSSSLITRAVSLPSQRSIYLVQGGSTKSSSNNNKRRRLQNHYQDQHSLVDADSGPYYLCLFPDDDPVDGNNEDSHCYYCSCRSFYDRSTRQLAPLSSSSSIGVPSTTVGILPTATTTTTTVLCKHLLALVLRPHLDVPVRLLELSTDEEFGNYVLERIGV